MSERITYNPHQCGGKPCIRGMRILKDFPDLEAADLEAALRYAAREVDHPVLVA